MPLSFNPSKPIPFYDLDPGPFQELCRDLFEREEGINTCEIFGVNGQHQRGIDLKAQSREGYACEVGQCKCYKDFPPRKIQEASKEFLKYLAYWKEKNIRRFILFVACPMDTVQQQEEIDRQIKTFHEYGIVYEVWSARTLRTKLQGYHEMVWRYSRSREWVEAICGIASSEVSQIPNKPEGLNVMSNAPSAHLSGEGRQSAIYNSGTAPPLPESVIGRDVDLTELKKRLGVDTHYKPSDQLQVLTAVRGWPGVGKTTLATALAHEPDVIAAFPDGILWTSLGQTPSILPKLCAWGAALGVSELRFAQSIEEASARLRAILRDRRVLIIVDDVWDGGDFEPFRVGGTLCSILITTRLQSVARGVPEENVYPLGLLQGNRIKRFARLYLTKRVEMSSSTHYEKDFHTTRPGGFGLVAGVLPGRARPAAGTLQAASARGHHRHCFGDAH